MQKKTRTRAGLQFEGIGYSAASACSEDEGAVERGAIVRSVDHDLVARVRGHGRISRDEGLMACKVALAVHLVGIAIAIEDWPHGNWHAGGQVGEARIRDGELVAVPHCDVDRTSQRKSRQITPRHRIRCFVRQLTVDAGRAFAWICGN